MFTVYVIKSIENNYIYVGLTSNLEERLNRHNNGYERATKPFRPFKLIYSETLENRIVARQREKYFKSGVGKKYLRDLL